MRRLTRANGWHAQLIRDHRGEVDVIVAVRIGGEFTDVVAIAEEREETVRSLRSAGLSTRAIASATGAGYGTVQRDLAGDPNGSPVTEPPPVTGLDGKNYQPRPAADEPIEAGLGLATKAAIDWESAWAGVSKTVDGNAKQMAVLEASLRDLAKELPATHQEIAAVAEAAGSDRCAVKPAEAGGEDRVIGMRYRTDGDRLILPDHLPPETGAVWFRDGRAEDVLAELLAELPDPDGGGR